MRVYISGPMTGYPNLNREAFEAAHEHLTTLGHEPIDPGQGEKPNQTWTDYLRDDLQMLLTADAVAVLPGWQASRGAALEVHVAHQPGMVVRPIETWQEAA